MYRSFFFARILRQAYGGGYVMTVDKILSFLKEVMFVGKLTLVEAESEVNFRIGRTESDPLGKPEAAAREAEVIRGRF